MRTDRKITVTDFASLQLEKQRLKAVCEVKKVKLDEKIQYLREHYPEVVIKTFLPFDDATNDRLFKIAKWVHDVATEHLISPGSKLGKFISGKGSTLLQSALIYFAVRIVKNIFFKRQRK